MEAIANFISIPEAIEKPLSEQAKRIIIQREIFSLLLQENIKILNWKRYVSYLKRYKISEREVGRDMAVKRWKNCGEKEYRPIRELTQKSFGIFTSHVNSDDMFAVRSRVQDALNRGESPTCYIYSLYTVDRIS